MAKKRDSKKEDKKEVPEKVFCKDCSNARDFKGNSCYCVPRNRRVCACDRYGRSGIMCRDLYNKK